MEISQPLGHNDSDYDIDIEYEEWNTRLEPLEGH